MLLRTLCQPLAGRVARIRAGPVNLMRLGAIDAFLGTGNRATLDIDRAEEHESRP